MNVYVQGDDFAFCKEGVPYVSNYEDYEITVSIASTGMPPIIKASTSPKDGELKVNTRAKLAWFINITSEVSNKLFPEKYNLQVTYKNISTNTKRTYNYSAIFSIKNKLN